MKKTLFLTAILAASLCSSVFGETVEITKSSGSMTLESYTAADKLIMNVTQPASGASAYFYANNGAAGTYTISADLEITSLYINNGWSNRDIRQVFAGNISGSGPITRDANQNSQTWTFTGDMSGYTGAIVFSTATNGTASKLVFDASAQSGGMEVGASTVTMQNNAHLITNGNVTFNGSITSSNTQIGTGVINLASGASLSGTTALADGASLQVAEGATATLSGTVNAQTTNGTTTARAKADGNGFGTADYTAVIGSGNLNTDGVTTWTLNGITATYTADTHTLSYQGPSTEYWFYTVDDISAAAGATKITVATEDTTNAIDMGNTDHGAIDLVISDSKVTVEGNDNSAGFVTGKVTIGAGSTLELTGHDALGYNSTATTAIEMQGEANNKAVLDNKDTGKLTLTTNLTLKGNTEVKGSDIKVFGTKVTATGTDNTIGSNLSLDNALTVEVTGAADTLLLTGNISGGNTLTQTGAGTMTIKGNTIGNGVGLNNTGSGTMVLDSVTLGGRVNLYNNKNTVMTGGATATTNNGYVLVISNGPASSVTMTNGTYDMGTNHIGIAAAGTLTVAKDAALTVNNLYNSSTYLTSNGTLNIQGEGESKGSVTANGATYLTTLNNEGNATFNGAYTGTNVNLKDGSTTTFGGTTAIATLNVTGDATITNAMTLAPTTALTMKEGATLSIGQHEDSLVSVQTLTVEGAATLNANLELAAAATLHMDGTLTMGCDVELGEGITLEGNLLASLLDGSTDSITLFTSVDALTLGGVDYSHPVYGYEVFSNPELVNTDDKKYVVSYNGSDVKLTVVPEPATATLSLLALAALAARRRRH